MDRSKDLQECIKEYRANRMESKRGYWMENAMQLEPVFCDKLNLLIAERLRKQEESNTDKIKYLFLCRLLSSGYTGSYKAILGMSSTDLYLDERRSQVYWYPEPFYRKLEQDMNEVERIVKKNHIRVKDSELFALRQILLSDDWILLQECILKLAKTALNLLKGSSLQMEEELVLLCGDYMDRLQIIWHDTTEGGNNDE